MNTSSNSTLPPLITTAFTTYSTTTLQSMRTSVDTTAGYNASTNTTTSKAHGMRDDILGATLLPINILIIILNLFIIMVIVRFRTKNTIDLFVLALACTDLMKGLIPIPMTIVVYLTDWYLVNDSSVCNFYGWIAFATNSGSMLILTFMAIDRYLAIVRPFSYKAWVRPKKVLSLLLISWLFTAFHSSLPLIGVGSIKSYNGGAYSHFDYSRATSGTIAYSIFVICYGFSMIVVVMIAYGFVFREIRDLIYRHRRMSPGRSSTITSSSSSRSIGRSNLDREVMFSYLTVVLMILFWFSWVPFLVVVIASQIGAKPPHEKLDLFTMRIVVINSLLNPIACAALCKPYRSGVLYYFKKFFSYFGFERPDSNIWEYRSGDPGNTRRLEPSVCNANYYDPERTGLFRSLHDYNEDDQKLENSSGSTSSGVSSSSSIETEQNKTIPRKGSRNRDDSKDHNKNILGGGGERTLTPSHKRKQILMEKVHKYLGQKRRRGSYKMESPHRKKRSNSADDILNIDTASDDNGNKKQRKARSFHLKNQRLKKDPIVDGEESENEQLLIRERVRSRTVNAIDEFEDTLNILNTIEKDYAEELDDVDNEQVDIVTLAPSKGLLENDTYENNITAADNNCKNGGMHLRKTSPQDEELGRPFCGERDT